MSGPAIRNPTPAWLRRENASVLDSPLEQLARMLASIIGADDPSGQAMGIAAPVDVPGGATSPMAQALSAVGKKLKGIKAYHGSPHDFDKFSLDKIGTGEGAQAYGHGLYFADNEGIARSYRDQLSRPTNATGERLAYKYAQTHGDPQQGIQALTKTEQTLEEVARLKQQTQAMVNSPSLDRAALDVLNDKIDGLLESAGFSAFDSTIVPRLREDVTQAKALLAAGKDFKGKMYEVNIAADPDDFLDWDAPLSQQSEKVRQIAKQVGHGAGVGPTKAKMQAFVAGTEDESRGIIAKGEDLYRAASDYGGKSVAGSDALKQGGIPGIKYLDGQSRSAGEGSRNYVVFDDQLISIVKKYGIVGALSAGLINQTQAQQLKDQGY